MTTTGTLKELKSMGTAQNRKIYSRHGVVGEMYGVSYANLGKLKKKIKVDHQLALELWATGNHDARVLATMIADPEQMKASTLDAWVRDLDNPVLTDAFAGLISRTPYAAKRIERWAGSRNEWTGRAGWHLVAQMAMRDQDLPDRYFEGHLKSIEKEIHGRKNRVRESMNGALIAIGMRSAALEKKAMTSAARVGKVEVDHGETGCKTPDAALYIKKGRARKKEREG